MRSSELASSTIRTAIETARALTALEYIAEQFELKDIYDINRARRDVVTQLEEQLMTASTILLKNDNELLPLKAGIKVYYESNNASMQDAIVPALGVFAEMVDDMDEADVIIVHAASLNDAYQDIRDDALCTHGLDPRYWLHQRTWYS